MVAPPDAHELQRPSSWGRRRRVETQANESIDIVDSARPADVGDGDSVTVPVFRSWRYMTATWRGGTALAVFSPDRRFGLHGVDIGAFGLDQAVRPATVNKPPRVSEA